MATQYLVKIRNATDNGNGYLYLYADNGADDEVTLMFDGDGNPDQYLFVTVWDHNGSINFYCPNQGGYLACPNTNGARLRINRRRSSDTIWVVNAGSNCLDMRKGNMYMVPEGDSLDSSSRDPRPVICSNSYGSYHSWVFEAVTQNV